MKEFVLSCIQISIIPNAISENTEKCIVWLKRAMKESNPSLVCFPETITTGFSPGMDVNEFYEIVEPLDGVSVKKMCNEARLNKVWILFPTYEKGPQNPVIYNSAVLINPDGNVSGVYRKTHPFPTERIEGGGWTTPGVNLPVFDTGFVRLGVTICYEGDFPELSRILAINGAELILRPSALLRSYEIWDLTNRARAYDNHVYFAGVNIVGADAVGTCYFGNSMIVSPIAQKLAQARGCDEIISAVLDPEPLKYVTYGSKSPMIFDHLEDRNVHLYGDILKEARSGFEPSKRIPYSKKSTLTP